MFISVSRFSWTPLMFAIAGAALLGPTPRAHADVCYKDAAQTQVTTDCAGPQDYEIRHGRRKPAAQRAAPDRNSLRERLRRSLNEDAAQRAQASKIADRIAKAQDRATDALRRGNEATDAAGRAKAQRDYTAAMKDVSRAYDAGDAAMTPEQRADWQQMKQQALADFEGKATQAFTAPIATAAAAPEAPRKTPNPHAFQHCEPGLNRHNMAVCYEFSRTGESCIRQLTQNGDSLWDERQPQCERKDLFKARDAYFKKLDQQRRAAEGPPQFGDGDRRRLAALSALSPKCLRQLNTLLENADNRDKDKANAAYITLLADCEASMRKLAHEADARLPERRLSERSRRALDLAMSRDPHRVAESVADRRYDAPYNVDEIIDFGLQLTDLLGGAAGVYARRNIPTATVRAPAIKSAPTPYKSAAPPYKGTPTSKSTITGLGE